MRREQRRFSLLPRDLSGGIVVSPANHRLSALPELHRLRLLSRIRTSSPFHSAGSRLTCVAGKLASAPLGRAFFAQRRRLPLAPSSSLFLSRLNSPMAARRLQAHSLRRALSPPSSLRKAATPSPLSPSSLGGADTSRRLTLLPRQRLRSAGPLGARRCPSVAGQLRPTKVHEGILGACGGKQKKSRLRKRGKERRCSS
ncbi:uncharacterized protein LOC125219328 [Salvia hispanica]|uniref:uncharacterized protein LOC125219328 n=1 Tax=Salvia hispanica TaxID=49212 RepID=UPI002009B11F|nr:uncharacterized protein LOC125219328 [Salvia hispanica]